MALAGCDADSVSRPAARWRRSPKKWSPQSPTRIWTRIADPCPYLQGRVGDGGLERKNRDGEFVLLKTYPICKMVGRSRAEEAPRRPPGAGRLLYHRARADESEVQLFTSAFNTGFPNAYDRAWGYTGSELMVHGDCSSRGCYAMTDEQIQENLRAGARIVHRRPARFPAASLFRSA